MSTTNFFDALVDDFEKSEIETKPFHTVIKKGEGDIHKWLKDSSESLMRVYSHRHHKLKGNLAAYRGLIYRNARSRSTYRQTERVPVNRTERLVVNHLHDMVETKVAQLTRFKPSIEVLPKNDEFGDKNAARASKMLIDHLFELLDVDRKEREIQRQRKIFGESYMCVTWDPEKGDAHPDAGVIDEETGKVVPDDLTVGEIDLSIVPPWRILLDYAECYDKSKYCYIIEFIHEEDLKKDYPEKSGKIKTKESHLIFDYSTTQNSKLEDHVLVFHFYHKKTKHVPEGYYAKFTADTILESGPHPYSHGNFPFVRIPDLVIPDVMHGVAQIDMIKPVQNMHNNLSSLIAKNIYLTAHPKWMIPKGACKIESLGNDATVVQWQGPIPPQLAQVQPNPPEVYAFRDKLKEEMEQLMATHGVSRGQPPAGITAAVAMQFLNEQELERNSSEISSRNDFVKELAKMLLSVASDYYETGDNRLIRILGKDNKYLLRHFDAADLSKPYDIKVELGNAVADTKAGKTQKILELIQYKSDALTPEQAVELLDLGGSDKAVTLMTQASRVAESEVEDILEGRPVADPEPYEDLITHWRIKVKAMQSRSFKEEVPPEFREMLKENVQLIEFLMTQKMKENPKFSAEVAQLSLFPLFYREGAMAQSSEQQEAIVQGQANRGESITGAIPAGDPLPLPGEPNKGE